VFAHATYSPPIAMPSISTSNAGIESSDGRLAKDKFGLAAAYTASITRKAMLAALRKEPRFSELFVTYLVTRSNRIDEDLTDQLFNSSEKRLARLLLLLANLGKNGKPPPIDASINQATLAEMIGTTRSRVSFFLKGAANLLPSVT
jgi:hypothetical protein